MAYIIILRLNSLGKRRATISARANFLSILQEKPYFFYFTHPLLQNTYISLSILHIYLIKYSFFTIFYYSPSPPLSLTDQHSLTDPNLDPTLSHRPRPNTQRKVAIVFVGMRAPLFSSASSYGGPMIEMARFLDRSSYACLSIEDPGP